MDDFEMDDKTKFDMLIDQTAANTAAINKLQLVVAGNTAAIDRLQAAVTKTDENINKVLSGIDTLTHLITLHIEKHS
jgi:tRNA A37 threonylcarbamoyltransferase TsaD